MEDKNLGNKFDLIADQTVRMGRARFTDPFTKIVSFVAAPGAKRQAGDKLYDPTVHEGHLHCEHCEAKVRFRPASETAVSGSSLKGNNAHFVTMPKERHDLACEYFSEPSLSKPARPVDRDKGFRIHLNTAKFSDLYTQVEGVYRRRGAILEIVDKDLEGREIYNANSVKDFVTFMTENDPERVNDSVIIFGNVKVGWKDFFIRYSRNGGAEHRFWSLADDLRKDGKDQGAFCLMEIQLNRRHTFNSYEENLSVYSRAVPYIVGDDGRKRNIIPSVTLDRMATRHNTHLQSLFNFDEHKYLALAIVTMKDKGEGPFYINMRINDTRQALPCNIENIAQEAKRLHQEAAPTFPESQPK